MSTHRRLPSREHVFALSLMYHGFRFVRRRENLKKRNGYVIPATSFEDSGGLDFWVKMPGDTSLVGVQVTQRGDSLYRKHRHPSADQLIAFTIQTEKRLRKKRKFCRASGIAFVLVRDFDGLFPSRAIAWGDVKSLRYWMARR